MGSAAHGPAHEGGRGTVATGGPPGPGASPGIGGGDTLGVPTKPNRTGKATASDIVFTPIPTAKKIKAIKEIVAELKGI